MKAILYSRHNVENFMSYVSMNSKVINDYKIISELKDSGDYSLHNRFNLFINDSQSKQIAEDYFDPEILNEIIVRCRVLRSLDPEKSIRMI